MRRRNAPASYFDPHFDRTVFKIMPGEFFVTTRPCVIATVLGSCVAACIRDRIRGSAGMNHFMLPADHRAGIGSPSLRYGAFAMESLINEFIKHGSQRADLEAKVFGGAAVMRSFSHADVGAQNAEFVLAYLAAEGIATPAVDLGGPYPRRVLLATETGIVRVKYLSRLQNDTIERREVEYADLLRTSVPTAAVELF